MSFERILAVKLREIGDAVIWTSALQSLRALFPEATIDVLVREHAEPILRGQPWISRIQAIPTRGSLRLARTLVSLRREKYDLFLGFHATNTLCNLAPLAGAPARVLHYHKGTRTPRFSTIPVPNPGAYESAIDRDHQILRALGFDGSPPPTRLVLSPADRDRAKDRLASVYPDIGTPGHRLLGLLPGGSRVTKRYPRDLWIELLDHIVATRDPVSLGVIVDRGLSMRWGLAKICAERQVPLFDDLTLRELIGVLSWTDVVITNDSGPKHVAVALGAKSVTLFGPSEVGEWQPYDRADHLALRVTVPCRDLGPQDLEAFRYCTVPECDHLSCLRQIDPDDIWSASRRLLDQPPQRAGEGSVEV